MTQRQKTEFEKKVNILRDFNSGMTMLELQVKYVMSEKLIKTYIRLGKNNYKVLDQVKERTK